MTEVKRKLQKIEYYRYRERALLKMADNWWKFWPEEREILKEAATFYAREAAKLEIDLTVKQRFGPEFKK